MYPIGDFARYLCVTPDFLKYYEKRGILEPSVNESGYRFFHFWERGQVIECIKLRNCGFSSREIVSLLNSDSLESYLSRIHDRQTQLQQNLQHLQAQMEAFDTLSRLSPFFHSEDNWEILHDRGFYFLQQTDYDTFQDDPAVEQAVQQWVPWMPTIQSAMRYPSLWPDAGSQPHPALGFVASTAAVAAYGLSTDPPVEAVPPRRCLQIYLKDQRIQPLNDDSRPASGYTTRSQQHMALIRRLLEAHNLKPAPEPYYVIKLLQLRENGAHTNYHILKVPLA